jgi:hypothetical protein
MDELASPSTRFRSGQSGNLKGRPRKPKQVEAGSAFDILLGRTLTATQDGVARELTIEEALDHRTYRDAIAGSRTAMRTVMKWILKREEVRAKLRPRGLNISFKFETPHPVDVDDAMILLGIAKVVEGKLREGGGRYLQLQSWAVNDALRRRGLKMLTDKQIDAVEQCTGDSEEIAWPSKYHR